MTEDILNKILVDMIDSGELELGWNGGIKEFRVGYFKVIENGLFEGALKCDIIYLEYGREFIKAFSISKEIIDKYMLQDNRDNIINKLLD
jgi:hypothetical protein